MDRITFKIRWSGAQEALLYYLIDNGEVIDVSAQDVVGRGEITVTYEAASSAAHRIEWSLMFPTRTLSELSASASLVGSMRTISRDADADQRHHWAKGMNL